MANAPIQLKKVTPGDVVAVPTGYVGFIAGSDGKFYAKDGSGAAVEIGVVTSQAILDAVEGIKNEANGIAGLDDNGDVTADINGVSVRRNVNTNGWLIGDVNPSGLYTDSTVVIGDDALNSPTGIFADSVVVGVSAGANITNGNGTVAVGRLALNTIGHTNSNTAIGDSTLRYSIHTTDETGWQNTAVGYVCGQGNTTGSWNVFIGSYCGTYGSGTGSHNVLVGDYAGAQQPGATIGLGNNNVGIGEAALRYAVGDNLVAIGKEAGSSFAGDDIIAIGRSAGSAITSANAANVVCIGYAAGSSGSQKADATNAICIGFNTFNTESNQVVIGDANITETVLRGKLRGFASVAFTVDTSSIGGPPAGPSVCNSGDGVLITAGASLGVRIQNNTNGFQVWSVTNAGAMTVPINTTHTFGNGAGSRVLIDTGRISAEKTVGVGSLADASAPNNSIYYSTTSNKLVYKDPSGTVNALY